MQYFGTEEEASVTATIVRYGDISHGSSVRCYTRQRSAAVSLDYVERPDTDVSLITFRPGRYPDAGKKLTNSGTVNTDRPTFTRTDWCK